MENKECPACRNVTLEDRGIFIIANKRGEKRFKISRCGFCKSSLKEKIPSGEGIENNGGKIKILQTTLNIFLIFPLFIFPKLSRKF